MMPRCGFWGYGFRGSLMTPEKFHVRDELQRQGVRAHPFGLITGENPVPCAHDQIVGFSLTFCAKCGMTLDG